MIFAGMQVERICLLYVVGALTVQNTRKNIQPFIYIFSWQPKLVIFFFSLLLSYIALFRAQVLTWLLLLISYCMRDMLQKVPEGDWLCEECKLVEETENQKQGKAEIAVQIIFLSFSVIKNSVLDNCFFILASLQY